ncbi:hypothetical protein [Aridibaculum aurantiacum]|uniref:hypothetical protein n=1 Tax=Aridibaculum aurantiacum TaxID=2810307 RepID=UPI001A95C21B|nr:hypothetical protein [Aridibaculum aurantiacum]
MKKYCIIGGFFLSTVLLSCNTQQEVKARIFERKEANDNMLLIKYQYQVNGTQYQDSAIIKNVELPGDSIRVKYHSLEPGKAIPHLGKQ